MKLHEIIELNEIPDTSISIEVLFQYKRSLLTYYRDAFCCEPILMVTDVFNAAQYGKIVPSNDYHEAQNEYLETMDLSEEETQQEAEVIDFNSIFLEQLKKP